MLAHGGGSGCAAAGLVAILPDSILANDVGTESRCSGAPVLVSTWDLEVLVPLAFSRTKPLSFSPNLTSTSAPPVFLTVNDLVTLPLGSFRLPVMLPGVTLSCPAFSE